MDQGRAKAMRLWLIHYDPDLRDSLEPVMPGARWAFQEPRFLKRATLGQRGSEMRGRILEALRGLPGEVQKVSTLALKRTMGIEATEQAKKAFTRALKCLDVQLHGWTLKGRSLVRGPSAHGL